MAVEIVIPVLGISVTKGKIVEWLKQEGQTVEKGEVLLIVETEKVTTEVESPASGVVAKILHGPGADLPSGTVIGYIAQEGEALPDDFADDLAAAAPAESGPGQLPKEPEAVKPAPPPGQADKVRAMPAARWAAREMGLDLRTVAGTGPDGVILKKDVADAAAKTGPKIAASPTARSMAAAEGVELDRLQGSGVRGKIVKADVAAHLKKGPQLGDVVPMSSMRQVIARRLSESAFGAPHITVFSEICLDELLALRERVAQPIHDRYGIKPSVNDFLIKAVALNIIDQPMFNAQLIGDEIRIRPEVNIGLAAATDDGLIVPAVARADLEGIVGIARQRQDLVARARQGKLTLEEIERGTFTISSLAGFDVFAFTAIINPPQCAILSIGQTQDKLHLADGEVIAQKTAVFGLSVDHRLLDGAAAAGFLEGLKEKLENPTATFMHL